MTGQSSIAARWTFCFQSVISNCLSGSLATVRNNSQGATSGRNQPQKTKKKKQLMFRRSYQILSSQTNRSASGRTIVRDPRRKRTPRKSMSGDLQESSSTLPTTTSSTTNTSSITPPSITKQPFFLQQPGQHQQPSSSASFASTMGTYMLMGVGVSLGVTFVRVVLGF